MRRKDVLYPAKPLKKLPDADFGVLDIETEPIGTGKRGVGQFIQGATYTPERGYRLHDSMLSIVQEIFEAYDYGTEQWFAHNGMGFDYQYLLSDNASLSWIVAQGWRITPLASKMASVGISLSEDDVPEGKKPQRIALKDFMRIMPGKLSKITNELGTEHQKLGDIDFERGEIFNPSNPVHAKYLYHDIMGLYEAIDIFRKTWFELFHDGLGWTTPGMAMSAFKRTLKKPIDLHIKPVRDFCREAYHGGMTIPHYSEITPTKIPGTLQSIIQNEQPQIQSYDVHSMYPSQMLKGVPFGKVKQTKAIVHGKPAFYDVTILAPQTGFTFIAAPAKTGLQFPRGEFRTKTTSIELELALQNGYEIIEVHKGYVFESLANIFDDFVLKCQYIRYNSPGTIMEKVAKLAQNSLYGKFGSSELHDEIIFTLHPTMDMRPFTNPETGENIPYVFERKNQPIEAAYLHPEWAAWITAQARMQLTRAILNIGYERFVYSDTDSIKFVSNGMTNAEIEEKIPTSEHIYGTWGYEYTIKEWYCGGAKTYTAIFNDKAPVIRAKGVPNKLVSSDDIIRASHGERVVIGFTQGRSFQTMIHEGLEMQFKKTSRTITTPDKSLNWNYNTNDCLWEPPMIKLVQEEEII